MKYFLLLIMFLFFTTCNNSNNKISKEKIETSISAKELKSKIDLNENIKIIDVRSEGEYYGKVGHINGSIVIPLNTISTSIKEIREFKEDIFVICLSGKRSSRAVVILRENEISARNVEGGILAWNKLNK